MRLGCLAALACSLLALSGCDSTPTSTATGAGAVVRLSVSATVVAAPGAVVEAVASYAPNGGGTSKPVELARKSADVTTGAADGSLSMSVRVTECVKAAGGSCALNLQVSLKRNGVVLDSSRATYAITPTTQTISAATVQLFEISKIRIAGLPTWIEPGESAPLVANAVDVTENQVTGRTAEWSVVSGGGAVSISATGVLRATAAGPAIVRARVGGKETDLAIDVKPTSIAVLEVEPKDTTITVGGQATFRFRALSASGAVIPGAVVTWVASDQQAAQFFQSPLGGVFNGILEKSPVVISATTTGREGKPVPGAATLRILAKPAIKLDNRVLAFTTDPGQPLPAQQRVAISNGGGGAINGLRIEGPLDASISAELDRTTAPATLTVRPTSALNCGVSPLIFTLLLRGNSDGGPVADSVRVSITQRATPTIRMTPTATSFRFAAQTGSPKRDSVTVVSLASSVAGLEIDGLVASVAPVNATWLTSTLNRSATPASLTLRAEPGTLPPGKYPATAGVRGVPNCTANAAVEMRVIGGVVLALAANEQGRKEFDFGSGSAAVNPTTGEPLASANRTSRNIDVSSTEPTDALIGLKATAPRDTLWLVARTKDTSVTSSAPTALTLTVDPLGLSDGVYRAPIIVSTQTKDAAADTVYVTMTIKGTFVQARSKGTGAGVVSFVGVSPRDTLLKCTLSPRYSVKPIQLEPRGKTPLPFQDLCVIPIKDGQDMEVSATAWPGSRLDSLQGCRTPVSRAVPTVATCRVPKEEAAQLKAWFTLVDGTTRITVNADRLANGSGTVVDTVSRKTCALNPREGTCVFTIPFESTYSMDAKPDPLNRFVNWSGEPCNSGEPTTKLPCTRPALGGSYAAYVRFDRIARVLLSPDSLKLFSCANANASASVAVASSVDGTQLTLKTPTVEYLGTGGWLSFPSPPRISGSSALQSILQVVAQPGSLPDGRYSANLNLATTDSLSPPATLPTSFIVTRRICALASLTRFTASRTLANVGDDIIFTVVGRNAGTGAADNGYLSIAFPQLTDPAQRNATTVVEELTSRDASVVISSYAAGDRISDVNFNRIVSGYLLTEYWRKTWNATEEHSYAVRWRPEKPGTYVVEAKISLVLEKERLGLGETLASRAPAAGGVSQQGETVQQITIIVGNPSLQKPQ